MTPPIWLIAEREFRAYAATASFWIALALGPMLMAGGLLLARSSPAPAPAAATLTLTPQGSGGAEVRFSDNFPLSPAARADLARTLERQGVPGPVTIRPVAAKAPHDTAALSRFGLVMLLWMTLTGSLGMLLQAVVRERSNRALESLLASARPIDIVLGKLLGVGAVSVLVLTAWLGSAAMIGGLAPSTGGLVSSLAHGLGDPLTLLRAGAIYLLAFGFYGLITVAVGAMARDNADAQNLARPMFAVLLAVFFCAMASAGGGAKGLAWLVYLPPFAPFMLLMQPNGGYSEVTALVLLVSATVGAGGLAVFALRLSPGVPSLRPLITARVRR